MTVLLDPIVALRGSEPAVVDERSTRSWIELNDRVARLVNALTARGLAPGDAVVAMLGNQCELVELSLACAMGGWVLVPLNWHWVAPEVSYVLDDARPVAVVVDERFVEVMDAALMNAVHQPAVRLQVGGEVGGTWEHYERILAESPATDPVEAVKGGPMFYTSGTTGHPKGVRSGLTSVGGPPELFLLIAHSLGPTINIAPRRERDEPSRTQLICGPMYHSAQWVFAISALLCGATLVLQHRFDAQGVLELIDQHGVTNTHFVPTQMARLVGLPAEVRAAAELGTLASVMHGAASCPARLKRDCIAWWGPVVSEYYGGTEGGFIATISTEEWLAHPGSVGRPLPVVEVRILGDAGEELAAGEVGEIWFRSLLGADFEYHNAPDKTASAHLDGFGTLGDVGYLDADGYLYLSDRKIDMIISGGVNIYPAEVEAALAEHPVVADVAVFGIPDEEMGESVHAAVVLTADAEWGASVERVLDAWCRERLAGYKRPRHYEVHMALPRNEAGKLLKGQLRSPWWDGKDRRI